MHSSMPYEEVTKEICFSMFMSLQKKKKKGKKKEKRKKKMLKKKRKKNKKKQKKDQKKEEEEEGIHLWLLKVHPLRFIIHTIF